MRLFSVAIVMTVALMLAFMADASAGEKKKKKKTGLVAGTITTIERGKDGAATLTLKVKGKKGEAAKEVKLDIAKDTKIEKAVGKKKEKLPPVSADQEALQQGQLIIAHLRDGSTTSADTLTIANKKKKKKAA